MREIYKIYKMGEEDLGEDSKKWKTLRGLVLCVYSPPLVATCVLCIEFYVRRIYRYSYTEFDWSVGFSSLCWTELVEWSALQACAEPNWSIGRLCVLVPSRVFRIPRQGTLGASIIPVYSILRTGSLLKRQVMRGWFSTKSWNSQLVVSVFLYVV